LPKTPPPKPPKIQVTQQPSDTKDSTANQDETMNFNLMFNPRKMSEEELIRDRILQQRKMQEIQNQQVV